MAVDAIGADAVALAHLGVDLDPLGDRPTVAVSEAASASHGWSTGAVLRLTFADGTPASVRVAAILPDADLPSPVVLPRAMVRAHDPSELTPVAYVAGADLSTVDAAVAGYATGAALQEVSGGAGALLLAWPQTVGVVAACLAFAVIAAVAATRPALRGPAGGQVHWTM